MNVDEQVHGYLEPHHHFSPSSEVVVTDLDNELVLMTPHDGKVFSLNATGRCLWYGLAQGSLGEAAAQLEANFDVNAQQAWNDAQELVAALLAAGLLQPSQRMSA